MDNLTRQFLTERVNYARIQRKLTKLREVQSQIEEIIPRLERLAQDVNSKIESIQRQRKTRGNQSN